MPLSWSHWPKPPQPNLKKKFFILNYTTPLVITGFEQLNLLPSYGWPKLALKGQIIPFLKSFESGQKLGFWPIILATDMLASQSRALFWPSFQQNFEPIEWVNGLGPRAGQKWPKFLHAHIVTSPPETPHRKTFSFDFDYKTCWIRRGFEQVSSSSGWRFVAKKGPAYRGR